MFVDKNSLIIDGVNVGQYITEVEYGYNKLWANDAGRSLLQGYNQALLLEYSQR